MGGEAVATVVDGEVVPMTDAVFQSLSADATEKRVEKARDAVLDLCLPDDMSQEEALDFLESVVSDLECSIDALRHEIEAAQEDA